MVEYQVTDASGNRNTCMVEVEVLDDLEPYLIPPADITLECTADYESTFITGELLPENIIDNCPDYTIETEIINEDFDKCGRGTATRLWRVIDASGNSSSRTQLITLLDEDPFDEFDIEWPDDVTLTTCDANTDEDIHGSPIIMDDVCSLVAVSKTDEEFTIVQNGCAKILRRWTVIDVCTYDENWYDLYDGLNGYGPGYYTHTQIIKIVNNNAPIISNTCQDTIVDFYGSCGGPFSYTVNATDDCTEDLEYRLSVDYHNDGIFEIFDEYLCKRSLLFSICGIWNSQNAMVVEDRCGNFSECDFLFEMKDAKAPTPYCLSSVATAVMSTDGTIGIWATDYDIGSSDNCTPHDSLIFSFTEDGLMPSYEFTCVDIPDGISATIPLEVWVIDSVGNKDYCTVFIELQDNNGNACEESETLQVDGTVNTVNSAAISGVMVSAHSSILNLPRAIETDESGNYSLEDLPIGADYLITARKNNDISNGVTTLDLVLIQKHILGLQYLDSPYKVIAADINNSSSISASDLIAMRKTILGISNEFPNGQESWRFAVKGQQFPDQALPFPFKESVNLQNLGTNASNEDFMGIKIGDVNNSVQMSTNPGATVRGNDPLVLFVKDEELIAGQSIEMAVHAINFENIVANQFTIEFDMDIIDITGIKSGVLNIDESNYQIFENEGYLTFSWNDVEALSTEEKEALFYLQVTNRKDGIVNQVLEINSTITISEAYDEELQTRPIELRFNESDDNENFVLMQNSPNPFAHETTISFILPASTKGTLSIYDVTGKVIKIVRQNFIKGLNSVTLTREELNTIGILYYKLEAGQNTATGKMIGLE